nr:DUF2207 domain-containing protein [Eubacterium sp.]
MKIQIILTPIIFALACLFLAPPAKADSSKFTIEKYHVRIAVTKENTYEIQEKIMVNFHEAQHGIYRDIPKVNKIYREDGSKGKTFAKIDYVSCGGTQYERTDEGNYYQLKIGDPDKKITGEREYFIAYDYILGNDILDGNDEFYFNVIGTQWETTIKNVTFEIHMPEEFSERNLGMAYGGNGSTQHEGLSYRIEGKSIYGALDPAITLQEGEGVTVRLGLPEGYFLRKDETKWPMQVAVGIGIFTVLYAFVLWWKVGRDEPVDIRLECYPPDGMNSLDVAFVYKGKVESEDVVSLVVYLAQKGYIEIREGDSEEDFVLKRQKKYDGKNEYERMFMNGLFHKRSTVRRADLVNSFYKTVNEIENKINSVESKSRLFHRNSLNKGLRLWFFAMVMFFFALVYPHMQYKESVFSGIGVAFCAGSIAIVGSSIFFESLTIKDRLITGIAFVVFALGHYWLILDESLISAGPEYPWMYLLVYALCMVITFLEVHMSKRNPYGTKMLGRVLGFKEYLETTPKEEVEAMVAENPQYYYDILPYTYVFGISKKWMSKFEAMAMKAPKWYRGKSHSGTSVNHTNFQISEFNCCIHSTMNSATSSMTSSPSSGGGFVGGGSGGGGGGSW